MEHLKKAKEAVDRLTWVVENNPQYARQHVQEYLENLEIMEKALLKEKVKYEIVFNSYCDLSVEVFKVNERNIFDTIKKKIGLWVVNYYLNNFSGKISTISTIQRKIDKVKPRLNQFKYFTS